MNDGVAFFVGVIVALLLYRLARGRKLAPENCDLCFKCWRFCRCMLDGNMTCLNCGDSEWSRRSIAAMEAKTDADRTEPRGGHQPRLSLSIVKPPPTHK